MKLVELEDRGVKRMELHEKVLKGDSSYVMPRGTSTDRKAKLEHFKSRGQLNGNPFVDRAFTEAKSAELKIRKCRMASVSGVEKQKFEAETRRQAIVNISALITGKIKNGLDEIFNLCQEHDKQEKDPNYSRTSADLLALERAKLKHSFTDEATAMVRLNEMKRVGYDAGEVLVLSAKGKRARERAVELKAELPEYLADSKGIQLLKELEELLELRPGEVNFRLKDVPNTLNKINVLDLVTEVEPSIEDVN